MLGGVSRVDLTHVAAGPFAEHKVDGRALTVSVSHAAAAAVEGGALAFALALSRAVDHEVGVTWSTADGTAVSGEDYVAVMAGTVTFAPGDVTATVTVATVQDALDETSETLEVVLEAASGGAEVDASAGRATGTVADDDAAPEVVVSGVTVSEGEAAELALTLSGPSGRAVAVTWSTVDGTAVSGADYVAVSSGEVMFAAGRDDAHGGGADARRRGARGRGVVRGAGAAPAVCGRGFTGGGRGDGGHRPRTVTRCSLGGGFDAPALPTEEVWSADLTVGTVANLYGYYLNTFGALTDTEFSLDDPGYSVVRLYHGGDLTLGLNRTIPSEALDDLVVRLGGRHFLLSDAVYVPVATQVHLYVFSGVSLGWTVGETIPVGAARLHRAGRADGVAGDGAGDAGGRPRVDGAGAGRRRDRGLPGGVLGRRGRELAGSGGGHRHRGTRATATRAWDRARTRHYRVRGIGGHGNPGPPSWDGVGDDASRRSRPRGDVGAGAGGGHVSGGGGGGRSR